MAWHKPLLLACLVFMVAGAAGAADQAAKALLVELKNQPQPQSWDYTFVYHRLVRRKSKAAVAKDPYLKQLDAQLAKLPAKEPADAKKKADLQRQRDEYFNYLTQDKELRQKQRVRCVGAKVRYETLEDLGNPTDPQDPQAAKRAQAGRSAIYLTVDGKSVADVNAALKTVTLMPGGFAYPNLGALIRPQYAQNFEEFLRRKDLKLASRGAGAETTLTLEFGGGFMHLEMAVDPRGGAHLLREKIFTLKVKNEDKTLADYAQVSGVWVARRIAVEHPDWSESLQIEAVKLNPALPAELFDYHKVAGKDFEVLDARSHPPKRYQLKDGKK